MGEKVVHGVAGAADAAHRLTCVSTSLTCDVASAEMVPVSVTLACELVSGSDNVSVGADTIVPRLAGARGAPGSTIQQGLSTTCPTKLGPAPHGPVVAAGN